MNLIASPSRPLLSWFGTHMLPYCTVVCAVVLLGNTPVPYGNENFYLLRLYSTYHADFLLNDWIFSSGGAEHFVFNHIFGLLTLFLPIEAVGWLGRLISWAAIIAVLFRLASHFGIGGWESAAVLLAWIGTGQSLVGGEWVFMGFEAKCVSYFLLFASSVLLLEGKEMFSAFALGLSFSFHPAVGLWGGLATAAALPAVHMTARRAAAFAILTGVGMLPGAIPLVPLLVKSVQPPQNDWAFLALMRMPHHLDPFSWPRENLFALFLLWLANGLYFAKNKSDRTLRFAFFFQTATGVVFIAGIIWRMIERYDLLQYFPFRLFPLITPLFFFLFLAKAIHQRQVRDLGKVLCCTWGLALICLSNPIADFAERVSRKAVASSMTSAKDDLQGAFQWVSVNTPLTAIGIAPPWRIDAWNLSKRGFVVNYRTPLYHKLSEWRDRVEKLVGPIGPKDTIWDLQRRYEALSEESIVELSRSYGADFLVSRSSYAFPLLAQIGTYNIYDLTLQPRIRGDN